MDDDAKKRIIRSSWASIALFVHDDSDNFKFLISQIDDTLTDKEVRYLVGFFMTYRLEKEN